MRERQQGDERLVEELMQADVRARIEPVDRQEGEVDRVRVQVLQHHLARLLLDHELDPGMPVVEGGEQAGEVERAGRAHRADHDAAGPDARELGQLGRGRLDLRERAPRTGHQPLPGRGQGDVPRGAVDERDADLVLEALDLLRERGLRDVQARRRAREVPLVGERDQVAQLAQFHMEHLSESDQLRL